MATEYWSCMFTLTKDEFPILPITEDNMADVDGIGDLVCARLGSDKILQGVSRKNWISNVIEDICRVYSIDSLKFLTNAWALLDTMNSTKAVSDIDALLQSFIVEPKIISNITGYSELNVLEAIKEAEPSLSPRDGLDNDSIYYLMPLLVSVKKFLQDAIEQNLYIMFFQPQLLSEP